MFGNNPLVVKVQRVLEFGSFFNLKKVCIKLTVIMAFESRLEMLDMTGWSPLQNCFAVLLLLLCLGGRYMIPIVKLPHELSP